jgi:hypothetical protein
MLFRDAASRRSLVGPREQGLMSLNSSILPPVEARKPAVGVQLPYILRPSPVLNRLHNTLAESCLSTQSPWGKIPLHLRAGSGQGSLGGR